MAVAIIGSRGFEDYGLFCDEMTRFMTANRVETVVSGGARGADTLARRWATERGIRLIELRPDYSTGLGRLAPLERNKDIIDKADHVIAFWDGKSPGTRHALAYARSRNKKVVVVAVPV